MATLIVSIGVMVVVLGSLAAWAIREDRRLSAVARRYRELEFEGIEDLSHEDDPYPEFAGSGREKIVEPDGTKVDAKRVLHDELWSIRKHMRRQRDRKERHASNH